MPTKALLHAASIYDAAKRGSQFGIRGSAVGYNYPSVKAWKDLAVKRTGAASGERYYQSRGISVFHGDAHFIGTHEITVNRRERVLAVTAAEQSFTFTGISRASEKPPGAWTPEQVVEFMIEGINRGDFYILCPDNEVTRQIDEKRIRWAADDLRSLNAHIEVLLREALKKAGRDVKAGPLRRPGRPPRE